MIPWRMSFLIMMNKIFPKLLAVRVEDPLIGNQQA
jgi:hypothetical protein